jgi:hypothetical protein
MPLFGRETETLALCIERESCCFQEEGRDCEQSNCAEQGPGYEGWPDRRGWEPSDIDGRASDCSHSDMLNVSRFLGPMVVRSVELRQPCQEAKTKHTVVQRAVHTDCVTACRYHMPLMHHVNTCGYLVALMMPQDRSN